MYFTQELNLDRTTRCTAAPPKQHNKHSPDWNCSMYFSIRSDFSLISLSYRACAERSKGRQYYTKDHTQQKGVYQTCRENKRITRTHQHTITDNAQNRQCLPAGCRFSPRACRSWRAGPSPPPWPPPENGSAKIKLK